MKSTSHPKTILAILLSISLLATGCSGQWISVALADLPVLVQMALNIGTVVTTLQSGKQLSPSEAAAIQNVSAEASKDLNLLQTLYNQYQADPSAETIQKIQSAIADINQNLLAVLQAAHIRDATLSARVTAAVNLILATVTSFAQLIPAAQGFPAGQKASFTRMATRMGTSTGKKISIAHASDLKKQWNQQVCGPTGKAALDTAFPACTVR